MKNHVGHEAVVKALTRARDTLQELSGASMSARDGEYSGQIADLDACIASMSAPNPDENGMFWWMLAVGFTPEWVADGVDFTDDDLRDKLQHVFPHMRGDEIGSKVLGRPADELVAKEQGYKTVRGYRTDRDGKIRRG